MKALTLHNPHAHLVAIGAKQWETRSWQTNHRGLLAIHASVNRRWQNSFLAGPDEAPFFFGQFAVVLPSFTAYMARADFGAVVAVVKVLDCIRTEEATLKITNQERAFGDYTPGRWAWKMELLHRFDSVVDVPGKQGLWTLPVGLATLLRARAFKAGVTLPEN